MACATPPSRHHRDRHRLCAADLRRRRHESVFNLPGIGRLTVDAVLARDYPVIQAMILLTSLIYVTVNLLIDVAYTLLDPRIRY